jgi:hypothetical protein
MPNARILRMRISAGRIALRRIGLSAALLAAPVAAAPAETWRYRVELDPAAPLAVQVTVELPALWRAQDFSVQVRGMAAELMPQVTDLRCDGVPLAPDSAAAWRVQGWNCARLSWIVPVKAAPEGGIDPRARETIFEPNARFWLFSEATSLVRPVNGAPDAGEIEFAGGRVHGGAPAGAPPRRVVPGREQPSEFYVIGDLPASVVREGGAEVHHVDAAGIDLRALLPEQRRALRYFIRTAGLRQWTWRGAVIWLAGPSPREAPLTVAGHRTLLVAGTVAEGRFQHAEAALVWILREQYSALMPARLPAWVRESLAQYYAIKALRRSELPPVAVAGVERRLIDPLQAPRVTLREAQRRLQSGDRGARDDLHAVGAIFWDRLDRAIVRKSGFRTLDSMLPRLLAADWPDDRLPGPLLDRLHLYAGERAVDELLAQFVGT